MTSRSPSSRTVPWLLWFAVLGGAGAWSLHLVVGWGLEEIACGTGSAGQDLLGIGLVPWLAGTHLVLAAVAASALALSWRFWRRAERARDGGDADEPPLGRVAFMALFGLLSNGLFLLIIVYGIVSLLFLGPCLA